MKKTNVFLIHEKDDKEFIKNYHSVSLLLIFAKMFESLLYDVMLAFFSENNLFSPNLSRFRSSDSCINQLLSITHEILNAFNKGLEVCGIIFDISKTSDYVWHNGLLFKLRQNHQYFRRLPSQQKTKSSFGRSVFFSG